ncbi:MAG: tRNA 5-hydroxyuridine modification protein YegQ [Anaerolineae bacterium]|jgi:putative protease|nr:tRNA 5-hydroxyuridine modification protein YegQ [Anaerolineae bacterium]MBT3714094.1 tRNA 5-hydroxyuridine modification protein YegQ [Anaerolineae bacterium]MBT4309226.1 tRNA 5-hydroxyuridine modification protein YegQ [Anaerolineae bacterium]MBT4459314.1 tRNA 5-hydroxyuridine modification protein YegQ [Anaerolineae bacterium]MBT4841190.1 tRNA 5-hydroxyuridine modification protein YegQ [Anaerolineae bacterium]
MKKIELLSPAGSIKKMQYAFAYGADAVYAGQPRYSLRVRKNEFNHLEKIAEAISMAHAQGKDFLVASNLAPHNNKVRTYLRDMEPVIAMGPDALIMSDPGLIMMVREKWPDMDIHLSVQANAVNWATVKFWESQGLTRVILSRELSLDEVEEIRQHCPDIELEVFVHGALCIAYSGRCLLSGYMTHRDGNQGACTNSCRWKYDVHEAKETLEGDIIAEPDNPVFLLQEEERPGEYMPAFEDEHGTYIMNSKDLRAVQHVKRLIDIGIDSIKIEGRTKSHFYAARTAQVYRQAIDDALAGNEFNMGLMDNLESLSNRGFTEGFYRRHLPKDYQNYESGASRPTKQMFVGEVIERDSATGDLLVDVKNKFSVGDEIELMSPSGNYSFQLEEMHNDVGEGIDVALGSGRVVRIPVPENIEPEFALLMKSL